MNNNKIVDSGYPELPFWVNDHGLDALRSITIVSGSTVLKGGTVLGKVSTHRKYDAYNNGGSGGLEVAAGILFNRADPREGDVLASLYVTGVVRSGSLTGYDSNAKTDLPRIEFV
jgi:hypothetical protein